MATKPAQFLTKSLHTVTAVSRVAKHLIDMHPANLKPVDGVKRALRVLGQAGPWPEDDPTVLAAIKATQRLVKEK